MRVLILGGYGNFGARISRRIAAIEGVSLQVAGRDTRRGQDFVQCLPSSGSQPTFVRLDHAADAFATQLRELAPQLLIHTAGPFQGQDYRVAKAAIDAGAHYIDLADGREFVAGFSAALNESARNAGVLAVTGASSVPALSAAIIDAVRERFERIFGISIGISPGNRTERGMATVRAILGYVGRAYPIWRGGRIDHSFGWTSLTRHPFSDPVGARWLSDCEVPDIDLFPERYGIRDRIDFRAGLELDALHLGLWLGQWLRRIGLVRDWSRYADPLFAIAEWVKNWGSDAGAMHVRVSGLGTKGAEAESCFEWIAEHGSGPEIPCTPAVLLTRELAAGRITARGARPCLDLFTLPQVLDELSPWPIRAHWRHEVG